MLPVPGTIRFSPATNTLVTGPLMVGDARGGPVASPNGEYVLSAGNVHLTLVGVVLVGVAGLVLMHRAGFRFSVTVGGAA